MVKTGKRFLSILLVICTLLTMCCVSASAQEEETNVLPIMCSSAKAVKLKDGDAETVLQIQIKVGAKKTQEDAEDPEDAEEPEDPEEPEVPEDPMDVTAFDTVDTDAEILILEPIYFGVYSYISMVLAVSEDKVAEDATIAKAKAVSYEDGILTLDIFSKKGEAGAKMVSMQLQDFYVDLDMGFCFVLPEGLLKNKATGKISAADVCTTEVDGLAPRALKLPRLVRKVAKAVINGDFFSLLKTALGVIPFAIVIVPILWSNMKSNVKNYYKIYGINTSQLFRDGRKAIRRIVPMLIKEIKSLF